MSREQRLVEFFLDASDFQSNFKFDGFVIVEIPVWKPAPILKL